MSNTRKEHDLLGDRDVPADAYYGVQTLRAFENFNITGVRLHQSRTPSSPPVTKSSPAPCTTNSSSI